MYILVHKILINQITINLFTNLNFFLYEMFGTYMYNMFFLLNNIRYLYNIIGKNYLDSILRGQPFTNRILGKVFSFKFNENIIIIN